MSVSCCLSAILNMLHTDHSQHSSLLVACAQLDTQHEEASTKAAAEAEDAVIAMQRERELAMSKEEDLCKKERQELEEDRRRGAAATAADKEHADKRFEETQVKLIRYEKVCAWRVHQRS